MSRGCTALSHGGKHEVLTGWKEGNDWGDSGVGALLMWVKYFGQKVHLLKDNAANVPLLSGLLDAPSIGRYSGLVFAFAIFSERQRILRLRRAKLFRDRLDLFELFGKSCLF